MPIIGPLANAAIRRKEPRRYRFYNLARWIESALGKGDIEAAEGLAREYLDLAKQFESDWNYGNAIHTANQVLGLMRLDHGDEEGAKRHLLAAGATPGSPQLNTFGPRMTLARELLEAGEREPVLRYLALVSRFWCKPTPDEDEDDMCRRLRMDNRRTMEDWRRRVRKGEVPEHPNWTARQWGNR